MCSVAVLRVFAEGYSSREGSRHRRQQKVKRSITDGIDDNAAIIKSSKEGENDDHRKTNGLIILEALAATGLRSIRYALEVPNVTKIFANDVSSRAVEAIKTNVKENNVESLVTAVNNDAVWLMHKLSFENKQIDVIDLDPYGCPTQFLDSAVSCVEHGGMLMVTCTDMAVLAGNSPETCFLKYGAISLRSAACHEIALRIALYCIASHCGRYGKYMVPLLSLSADFYIRLFVRVYKGQQISKKTSSNVSIMFQCCGCETFTFQPLGNVCERSGKPCKYSLPPSPPVSTTCSHCQHKHRMCGPMWSGKLHDVEFVDKLIAELSLAETSSRRFSTGKRMVGMLSVIKEELPDSLLYYTVDSLCSKLHCQMIPLRTFRSALLNGGYRVSLSHCKANSLKTDAPVDVIWDILRQWVKTHPVAEKRLQENNSVAANILKQQSGQFQANFNIVPAAIPSSVSLGLLRFQMNPQPYWGPGTKAKSNAAQLSKADDDDNKMLNT